MEDENYDVNEKTNNETDLRALFYTDPADEEHSASYTREDDEPVYAAKPKKSHGKFWKRAGAILGVIVLGFGSGFGGAYTYQKVFPSQNAGSGVIYQNVSTNSAQTPVVTGSVESVVNAVEESVVQISTEQTVTGGFFGTYVKSGAGSGVIITADGYIVTNHHVISGATKITVTLKNNEQYDATLIGADADSDLAVLKINVTGLKPAVLGDSETLSAGQSIVVIGNPLGTLGGSVTSGVVSAMNRNITIEGTKMTLIQIDAAVNPGNSGGALFNMNGDLVGIVNAKYASEDVEGIGFAIPINQAKTVIEQLINQGYVSGKVLLGIGARDILSDQMAFFYNVKELGVYITEVRNGSDAENAGLKVGDRIISVDGQAIESATEISPIVQSHVPGDQMTVVISRNGEEITVEVTLTEQGNKI
ncbi:MAG: trypsin-like peptidase domain-containing protein [Erysipelotrichales bacterium]|nr:trypsin-like peptidase domain-containing protein [Erysipelotrichales bacterium]